VDNPEVAVEGRDLDGLETFGCRHDRCIHRSQREVAVASDEFRDPQPVARVDHFGRKRAAREVAEKADLGLCAEPSCEQIRDLTHDENRDDQRAGMSFEQFQAGGVMGVVGVYVCVQRPCVDEQHGLGPEFDSEDLLNSLRHVAAPAPPGLRGAE
jgi:hypothetical protein